MDPVESVLLKQNISYKSSGKDCVIKCLNPEHDDSNPSCRVDKATGIFHCFSCGYKGNIFKHFGLLTDSVSVKLAVGLLRAKLKELSESSQGISFPEDYTPITTSYRNISVNTLKKFEAFSTDSSEKLVDRICFPIRSATGDIVAFIGRHTLSNANPRYQITPSGKPLPCYPIYIDKKYTSIVLVEGIFDMLNLYDKGLENAVCTFGTNTITEKTVKSKLLPYKVQGIHKVYIMYDGDEAGRKASEYLKTVITNAGFMCEQINLEDDTDPGDLSIEDVRSLNKYINEETNSSN